MEHKQEEIEEIYDDISFIPNICSNKTHEQYHYLKNFELKREKEKLG